MAGADQLRAINEWRVQAKGTPTEGRARVEGAIGGCEWPVRGKGAKERCEGKVRGEGAKQRCEGKM